jgi:oxygen-independent coproporphyrinogen-3 oxidase
MGLHVYVHIPYCISKCRYCSFSSVVTQNIPESRYIRALLREAGRKNDLHEQEFSEIETLYIGGGTPTALRPSGISAIVEGLDHLWGYAEDAEISIEANPETITRSMAQDLKATGINRISLGVQSFSERLLNYLGRVHGAPKAHRSFEALRQSGFDNINIDLIYGIPSQSMTELESDLSMIAVLQPEHVSAYLLQHEAGTFFEKVPPCPDAVIEKFFYTVIEILEQNGLEQYEISNFSIPSHRCRHNLAYWQYRFYIGLGASAVSCPRQGLRTENIHDPDKYMNQVENQQNPTAHIDRLCEKDIMFEKRFLALRTKQGIDMRDMPLDIPNNLYEIMDNRCVLTTRGMLVSNEIFLKILESLQ